MNYYEILGISKNASDDEIRKAYKKQALHWHPDRNKGNEAKANEKFQEIAKAYSTLSDPEKRKLYDLYGSDDPRVENSGAEFNGFSGTRTFHNEDAQKLFEEFFSSSFSTSQYPRQRIIQHNLQCTLEELYTGSSKNIQINKENVKIDILAGWKEGTKVTFDNVANSKIIFIVQQKKHNVFTRIENDLTTTLKITLSEALKGFSKEIKLLDGSMYTINLKNIPSSDFKHVIQGKGMPIRKNGKYEGYGKLIVDFIVKFT